MLKKFIKEWYVLNKTQRRGSVVLLIVLLLAVLFKLFYRPVVDKDVIYFANLHVNNDSTNLVQNNISSNTLSDSLFFFNPNQISEGEMKTLGLSQKIIQNIIRYRQAGGKFFSKESLKKIYGMNDSIYQKIEPYILIESNKTTLTQHQPSSTQSTNTIRNILSIELNSADSSQLEQLKGIGKILSARIIKYRNRLGGFYSLEQLREVYGINDSLYNFIIQKNKISLDTHLITKINIQTADFKTMIRHPYFNKDLVISILNMQKRKEVINIEKIKSFTDEKTLKKLQHYIYAE